MTDAMTIACLVVIWAGTITAVVTMGCACAVFVTLAIKLWRDK